MTTQIDKLLIQQQFEKALNQAASDAFEGWKAANYVNNVMYGAHDEIPEQVARQLSESDYEDFIKEAASNGKKTQDEFLDYLPAFVDQGYDEDYFSNEFSRHYKWEEAAEIARNEAVLWLTNDVAYSKAPDSFWQRRVQQIPDNDIIELANQMQDNLTVLVDQYAPNWEDNIDEDNA